MHRIISVPHRPFSPTSSTIQPLDQKRMQAIKSKKSELTPVSTSIFNEVLQETQTRLTKEITPKTRARLTQRLSDIQSATSYFKNNPDVELLGIYGWGDHCQINASPGEGISQFDSIVYKKNGRIIVEKIGSCWQLFSLEKSKNQTSETITSGGESIRFPPPLSKKKPTPITPPFNSNMGFCMTADEFIKQVPIRKPGGCRDINCIDAACNPILSDTQESHTTDPLMIDTQEGCPCCLNAIDLDELAGLGKVLNNTESAGHVGFELTTVDTNWGIVAGVAGPFAAIGLVAAYRNMVGAYATRQILLTKLHELNTLIKENPTPQRLAYRYCLQYSLFDANWNIAVPGALNGGSSSAVLSTLILSSPLAIPAMGTYAAAQAGRGIYDTTRFWNTMTGHEKIDQITRSKRRFYMTNTTAFTCMAVGATLVAVSPLTLGATLIPGLCLLIPGTVSSGVLNNIWPRKFRPRNGDLGVARETLTSQSCATLINKIREQKSEIKIFKKKYVHTSPWLKTRRLSAKLMAVLPFCEDKAGQWLHTLTQEQMAKSIPQMTIHHQALFDRLGLSDTPPPIESLVTAHLKDLRYQQYGLVDFYWGLKRFEEGVMNHAPTGNL